MTNQQQPDPGDGWRWLNSDEVIRAWDEVLEQGGWRPVNPTYAGDTVYIAKTFRRRIDPQPTPQPDLVNAPPHYRQGDIECIDAIRAALTPEEFRGFCKGNVIKYTWRERHKAGDADLSKAGDYLNWTKQTKEQAK